MLNACASNNEIDKYMKLNNKCENIIKLANQVYNLSLRGYNKIIKVARTIADLEQSNNIEERHIEEALMFKETSFSV